MSQRLWNIVIIALALAVLACALFVVVASFAGGVGAAAPAPPDFTAQWDSATSATVQWTQVQRGCLYRESAIGEKVFVSCYERYPATIRVEFGHVGPLSGDLRPTAGDVYILVTNGGVVYRAPLVGRAVYMAVVRR